MRYAWRWVRACFYFTGAAYMVAFGYEMAREYRWLPFLAAAFALGGIYDGARALLLPVASDSRKA